MKNFIANCLNILSWTPWVIAIMLLATIGFLKINNKIREHYQKQGYDRAIAHCNNYYWQYGNVPDQKWADKYWRYINTDNGWVRER